MSKFFNYNYNCWSINLEPLKSTLFDQEFNLAFNDKKVFTTPETHGNGKTLHISQIPSFKSYNILLELVMDEIKKQQIYFNLNLFYKKRMKVRRIWANRMYQGCSVKVHHHPDSTVFLIYYAVPKNSGNLIFVNDQKLYNKVLPNDTICNNEKFIIPLETGRCVIHDGKILHAVTEHTSTNPRDVIVFDFPSVFN